jgi:cytoskeletal protein CcmA (bactofilin family)
MSNTGNGRPVGGKKTVVEQGTTFKGTLSSSCPIVVMGRIEGEVTGPAVEVTDGGALSGKAKVSELRSRGELAGEFEAEDVDLAGRVRDDTVIRARALVVAPGRPDGEPQVVFGECEIQVGDAPSKQQAVDEALAANRPQSAGGPAAAASPPSDSTAPELAAVPADEGRDASGEHEAAPAGGGRRKKTAAERSSEGNY